MLQVYSLKTSAYTGESLFTRLVKYVSPVQTIIIIVYLFPYPISYQKLVVLITLFLLSFVAMLPGFCYLDICLDIYKSTNLNTTHTTKS